MVGGGLQLELCSVEASVDYSSPRPPVYPPHMQCCEAELFSFNWVAFDRDTGIHPDNRLLSSFEEDIILVCPKLVSVCMLYFASDFIVLNPEMNW